MDIVYIYNMRQAFFYMKQGGVFPIEEPRINIRTNKIFWMFSRKETADIYDKWCKQCEKYKSEN